jgi:hypothetical protein
MSRISRRFSQIKADKLIYDIHLICENLRNLREIKSHPITFKSFSRDD